MPTNADGGLSGRASLTLWLTVCVDMIGFGIILPVLPYYAERYGASPTTIGALAAAFSITQLVAAPVLGRLGDRAGRRPVFLLAIAGSIVSMLVLALADSLAWLFAARLLAGSCGGNVATAHAYVIERAHASERAAALGRVGAAVGVGFVLGPVLGGLLASSRWPGLPFLVAALLGVGNWLLVALWLPEHRRTSHEPRAASRDALTLRAVPRPVLALVALNLGVYVAFAGMESTFALLLEARLDWGALETGLLFAWIGLTIVVSQGLLVGRVVARLGEWMTLRLGLVVLGLGLAGLAAGGHVISLSLAACAVALGNGLFSPSLHALLGEHATPGRTGASLGLASSAGSLGRVLGPAGAGLAFDGLGPGSPALFGAVLVLVLALAVGAIVPRKCPSRI
jgi:DHA1 family tetracycline resistance protein-like MFS transporter